MLASLLKWFNVVITVLTIGVIGADLALIDATQTLANASPGSPYLSYGWRPSAGGTTVAFAGKCATNSNPAVTSLSVSCTTPAGATGLYVFVAVPNSTAPASPTYNAVSMGAAVITQSSVAAGSATCYGYAMGSPAAGTNTLAVTLNQTTGAAIFGVFVTGSNTTTPTDGSIGGNNGGAVNSTISDTVSTANGDLVIDGVTNDTNSAITGWTQTAGQTALYTTTLSFNAVVNMLGGSYISATGATQAMGQTMGGGTDNIAHCVMSAKHG